MPRRFAAPPIVALVLAAPLAAFGWAAWSRRWMSDDGYIYLRVVRQIIDGHGAVFNHGERVEATTSPLWLALLTVGKLVLGPVSLPWLAVVLGLALSLLGLALAQLAAHHLWRRDGRIMLPLGAIVIAALPPFWDFATSGLETGLAFAWLGACFWGLVRLLRTEQALEPRASNLELLKSSWLPVLLGLGPLVRPDFAVFSLAFIVALFVVQPALGRRERVRLIALAIALPFAYEVFRMGYYAALVPNPAFAKEASSANWPQGWHYLIDTMKPYWLPLPLLLLSAVASPWWLPTRGSRDQRRTALASVVVAGALVHGTYVVYVGGDFMHARMLLPALFSLLMPVVVVGVDTALSVAGAAAVVVWAIVCATTLRPSYHGIGPHGIANERAYYVALAHQQHPITLKDYRRYPGEIVALIERAQASGGAVLILQPGQQIALRPDLRSRPVVESANIGIFAYVIGTDVSVIDVYGLADPIAGRLNLAKRGRPGHEKRLPEAWIIARFADPAALLPADTPSLADVSAARAALSCDGAQRLLDAVGERMTPGRFARNLIEAFRLHRLRIAPNPVRAQKELC